MKNGCNMLYMYYKMCYIAPTEYMPDYTFRVNE